MGINELRGPITNLSILKHFMGVGCGGIFFLLLLMTHIAPPGCVISVTCSCQNVVSVLFLYPRLLNNDPPPPPTVRTRREGLNG